MNIQISDRMARIIGFTIIGFFLATGLIWFILGTLFTEDTDDSNKRWRYPMSWDEALKKTNCPFFVDTGYDRIHGHASLPQGTIFGIKSTSTPKYYVAISEPTRLFISTFTDLIPYHECFKTATEAEAAGYEDAGTMDGISALLETINQ